MKYKDVFISYKAEDFKSAAWVKEILETNGISCWMAPGSIPGGSSYAREIPGAIGNCKVLVLILSEKVQRSQWVPRELDQAINENKVIIPFMIEKCELTAEFNFYLSNVQRYEAYANKTKTVEQMLARIRAVLGADSPVPEADNDPSSENVQKPPEEEAPAQKGQSKKRLSVKKLLIGALALLAAVAVAIGAVAVFSGKNSAYDIDKYYRVTLNAPVNESVAGFQADTELIRERLDGLFSFEKYKLSVKDTSLEVIFEKDLLTGISVEDAFETFIAPKGSLMMKDSPGLMYRYYPVQRKDIESVSYETGKLGGVVSKDIDTDKEYHYIRLKLTEDYIQEHKDFIAEAERPTFDIDGDWAGSLLTTYATKDETLFYLVDSSSDGICAAQLSGMLASDELSDSFTCQVDIEPLAKWESDSDKQLFGKLQVNAKKLKEPAVLFSYVTNYHSGSYLTDGEWTDLEKTLKTRLDKIGNAYAIGKMTDADNQIYGIAVKTAPDKINERIVKLLVYQGHYTLRCGLAEVSVLSLGNDITAEVTDEAFTLKLSEADEDLSAFLKEADSGKEVSLMLDDSRYLCTTVEKVYSETELSFPLLAFKKDGKRIPLSSENKWIAELVKETLNRDSDMPDVFYYDSLQLSYKTEKSGKEYNLLYSDKNALDDVRSKLKNISENAKMAVDDSSIKVALNLPVNTAFAAEVPEMVKEVYQLVDFENADADTLIVYLVNEDNEQGERARVIFNKNYRTYGSVINDDEAGCVYLNGIFKGGRIDLVKKEIVDNITKDKFLKRFVIEGKTDWFSYSDAE